MDGYREFYRFPVSADYSSSRYPTGYGTLAGEPLHSTYTRSALDAYAGYGAPVVYQPELMPVPLHPQYLSPRRPRSPRRRPPAQNKGRRRLPLSDSLTPKKKPFKKSQKGSRVENFSPRRDMQKQGSDRTPLGREPKNAGKRQESSAATLAKETEELHKLFRTGVDSRKAVKPIAKKADGSHAKKDVESSAKKNVASIAGQKRKADESRREAAKKKSRGKKKKFAKEKKQDVKKVEKPVGAPKVVKVEPAALTEEEKREIELSSELQKAACKGVAEFLGIPEKSTEADAEVKAEAEALEKALEDGDVKVKAAAEAEGEVKATTEAEKSEPKQASGDGAQEEKPAEAQDKLEVVPPTLSPEEEKELEEKGFVFFSKMLEENQDLRKLYIEKKDAGKFECLVCHSVDPTTSKKFANLTNLVMHTSMRKQKRAEHRGYGKAICDILGWESLRAPKRPVKQAKDDADNTKQVEAADKVEEKQEGTNDQ